MSTDHVTHPPASCKEIEGFIIEIFDGSAWLTEDLAVTDKWSERGVWPDEEAARAAMEQAIRKS